MSGPTVFVDACVLYPGLVRAIVLSVAERGLFQPVWSARVLDEWMIAVARRHGSRAESIVRTAQADMRRRFPEALLPPEPQIEQRLVLPDPADAHVAAAAAGGDILLTFNLRDFPGRKMRRLKLEVRHPDSFLWELWSHEPETVEAAIREGLEAVGTGWDSRRSALKRARLSRLGKSVADDGEDVGGPSD